MQKQEIMLSEKIRENISSKLYVKLINRFFPELIPLLKQVKDPRHQSYVVYGNHILLMTRILSSILYINSMRKISEEFNSKIIIENFTSGHISA